MGGALLAALLAAPHAWAAAPCGGHSFTDSYGFTCCGGAGSDNTDVIVDYDFSGGIAYGGYSHKGYAAAIDTTGKANGNTLRIEGNGVVSEAHGGHASTAYSDGGAEANGNKVFIDGGAVARVVYGGYAQGAYSSATGNTVNIFGTVTVHVSGGEVETSYSSATDNTVNIFDGAAVTATGWGASGGYAFGGHSYATNNTFNISGGSVTGDVFGGQARNPASTLTDNTVSISGGTVTGNVYGGYARDNSSNVTDNTVNISGGTVTGNVYGGYTHKTSTLKDNTVNISGGAEVMGNVYGGYARRSNDATDNTVTISGGKVAGNVLGGEALNGGEQVAGNTLKVQAKGLSVGGEVKNFENLAFTLPADIKNGETMLTVGGDADFSAVTAANFSFTLADGAKLNVGDTVTLIEAGTSGSGTLAISPEKQTVPVDGYAFEVEKVGNKLIATKLPQPRIIDASNRAEGTLDCQPNPVPYADSTRCDAIPEQGFTFDTLTIDPPGNATLGTCDDNGCELTGVVGDVTVTGVFKALPTPQPQQPRRPYVISDTPTLGEVGLLLSGIALAGAAAPALRRREKQGKKADTRQ